MVERISRELSNMTFSPRIGIYMTNGKRTPREGGRPGLLTTVQLCQILPESAISHMKEKPVAVKMKVYVRQPTPVKLEEGIEIANTTPEDLELIS